MSTSYNFEIGGRNTSHDLKESIDKLSKLPLPSTNDILFLYILDVAIMPPLFKLLIQLLNQPQRNQDSTTTSTTTTIERKWDMICFANCRVPQPRTIRLADNLRLLAATLACRTNNIGVWGSPEILEWLLHVPKLEMEELSLDQEELSSLDCQRLGALCQKNVTLKNLTILGPSNLDEPETLVECLAHCRHLQKIEISESSRHYMFRQQRGQALVDLVVRQSGNDIAGRLLRNPQSQLKILRLTKMNLQDCHFISIVEALPSSQLEELNVADNDIRYQGIWAFAKYLPDIKCLKHVDLSRNPWEFGSWPDVDWEKILEGLVANFSIECIDTFWMDAKGVGRLYCYLNWAGRRLLGTSSNVPLGLWPFILERAGKDNDSDDDFRPDAIYMFLQQSPILSYILSSCSWKDRPRKKNKIMAHSE